MLLNTLTYKCLSVYINTFVTLFLIHNSLILFSHKTSVARATTKRVKADTYDQVNKAMLKLLKRLRSKNVPVNDVLIKEKTLYFAKALTVESFQASDGWLDKWKKRLDLICFISDSFII